MALASAATARGLSCTGGFLTSSTCHRLRTMPISKCSLGRTHPGAGSRQAPVFEPYPILQQLQSSNSFTSKSNSSQNFRLSCHYGVSCFHTHAERRASRSVHCLSGGVTLKPSGMPRSIPLKKHFSAQVKLSKGYFSPYNFKRYSSNTCRMFYEGKSDSWMCSASSCAPRCKTLPMSFQRNLAYSLVCRGRYLSKDSLCVEESDGLQEDETVNDDIASCGCVQDDEGEGSLEVETRQQQFVVVNFYHFADIEDPHLEVAKHLQFMQGKNIHGRIYINEQGINAQLSGLPVDAMGYSDWVKQDSRFKGLLVQSSPSPNGHAFPKLRLRYKPSLVQVEGGTAFLPLINKELQAVHLDSHEWKEKLFATKSSEAYDSLSHQRKLILLDVRNGYEWDIGHFEGAMRPTIDCFKDTRFCLSSMQITHKDYLEGVDKNNVEIMMYCTGGIRCDVYSVILRQKGFRHLYSLKGGVIQYLLEQGSFKWEGNLFVFDSRLAVSPSQLATPMEHCMERSFLNKGQNTGGDLAVSNLEFARCKLCGELVSPIRHRNCANLDCNLLFLSCVNCVHHRKGCCSSECTSASRLRPVLKNQLSYDRYDRWHKYRARNLSQMTMSAGQN